MLSEKTASRRTPQNKQGRYTSPYAWDVMRKIEKFIESQRITTTAEIACQFQLSHSTACGYLRELRADGRIRVAGKCETRGNSFKWEIGEDPEFLAAESVPTKQHTTQVWEPNHRRHYLDYYLFGVRGISKAVLAASRFAERCVCCQSLQGEPHYPGCTLAIGVAA